MAYRGEEGYLFQLGSDMIPSIFMLVQMQHDLARLATRRHGLGFWLDPGISIWTNMDIFD